MSKQSGLKVLILSLGLMEAQNLLAERLVESQLYNKANAKSFAKSVDTTKAMELIKILDNERIKLAGGNLATTFAPDEDNKETKDTLWPV